MSSASVKKKKPNPNASRIPLVLGKTDAEFIADLKRFHHARRTPFVHIPVVLGKRISLLQLYNVVAAKGGFNKVTQRKLWTEVVREIGLPISCSNVNHAVQYVFQRYLDAFERARDPSGRHENVEEEWMDAMAVTDATMRRRLALNSSASSSSVSQIPMVHRGCKRAELSEDLRDVYGFSCDLREEKAYRLLEMSLMSGLPNEVDFVLNTILLLSSKGSLDIMQNPNLLNLLLATVGIYDTGSGSYYSLHEDWFKQSGRNFFRFWNENVQDPEFRLYLNPDAISNDSVTWTDSEEELKKQACQNYFNFSPLELDDSCYESDVLGSRVEVVGMIIRNLLMDSVDNLGSPNAVNCLASCSDSVLRFSILACGHSRDLIIHRLGLELISILRPVPLMRSGYSIARNYRPLLKRYLVDGNDRSELLRALQILTRVCESALFCRDPTFAHPLLGLSSATTFPDELFAATVNALMLRDLHVLITALEALLSLSCLDELVCRRICDPSLSVIPILVALLTLEAPSLGEDSLLRLRIFQPIIPPLIYTGHAIPQIHSRSNAYSQYYSPRHRQAVVNNVAGHLQQRIPIQTNKQTMQPQLISNAPPTQVIQPSRQSLQFASDWISTAFTVAQHARVSRLQVFIEYSRTHKAHFTGREAHSNPMLGEEQFYTMVRKQFPELDETRLTYPNGTSGIIYVHLAHVSKHRNAHPPNGIKRIHHSPSAPSPSNQPVTALPPSPPTSSDAPVPLPTSSVSRLPRTPLTPPRSPPPLPQNGSAAPSKLQVRQCIRNSILERSRRLKERSQKSDEIEAKRRKEEMLVAGAAEVHRAGVVTTDQVTLRRVPNHQLLLGHLPPMLDLASPKPVPVNGEQNQTHPKNGLHKSPVIPVPIEPKENGVENVKENGQIMNGDVTNEDGEGDEDENEEEDGDEGGEKRSKKRKMTCKKRQSSPSRYRSRQSKKRWSRKKPKTRPKSANGISETELQKDFKKEILRQMPGWEDDEMSTSDSSGEESSPSLPSCRPALGLLCEWSTCTVCFETPAQVFSHVFTAHFSRPAQPRLQICEWRGCPETLPRGLYSLLAHICERHCTRSVLIDSLKRRREAAIRGSPIPTSPAAKTNSGTWKDGGGISNAAMTCLMRFQTDTYVKQAALEADNKGPVTRHIRLTAALVLRNLAHHCPDTVKSALVRHENHLVQLALSNLDSSKVISHILNAIDDENT